VEELVRRLEASAEAVAAAARAARPALAGEWPPATVVGHLADVDAEVWNPRLGQMLVAHRVGARRPSFSWWEPDAAATAGRYARVRTDEAITLFLAGRAGIAARLRGLAPGDWDASARHETFGLLDIAGLVGQVLDHDEEHRISLLPREPMPPR
jgi:hypothetical protein